MLYEYLEETNAAVKASVPINHLGRAGGEFKRVDTQEAGECIWGRTTQANINVAKPHKCTKPTRDTKPMKIVSHRILILPCLSSSVELWDL